MKTKGKSGSGQIEGGREVGGGRDRQTARETEREMDTATDRRREKEKESMK